MRVATLVLLLPSASLAFQLPFNFPFFKSQAPIQDVAPEPATKFTPRIAIIGAGAGGSSAAFWISKAKERFGLNVEVDVYEKEGYVGGRSTVVYPHDDTSLPEVELGAAIFVPINKNLWRASDEFQLERVDLEHKSETVGIWDGSSIVYSSTNTYWDHFKFFWRYGFLAPATTRTTVSQLAHAFLGLYRPDALKWDDVSQLADSLNWTELLDTSTYEYFKRQGVYSNFIQEFIESATRVNYGLDAGEINALAGACSLATEGAVSIKGGNYQIFEEFLKRSGANLFLNTTVHSILPKSSSSYHWRVRSTRGATDYTAVILAAPKHLTKIEFPETVSQQFPNQPYVRLHVTVLTTTSPTPNPAYFSVSPGTPLPLMMLTTNQGFRSGGKEPEFNSVAYVGLVREGEHAFKLFSKDRVEDELLERMFGNVGWVHRKEWDAYPVQTPTNVFPPVKVDTGFYYVNSFEPFISTMETATVSARNIVDVLLNDEFNTSICGSRISEAVESDQKPQDDDPFVLGWDC